MYADTRTIGVRHRTTWPVKIRATKVLINDDFPLVTVMFPFINGGVADALVWSFVVIMLDVGEHGLRRHPPAKRTGGPEPRSFLQPLSDLKRCKMDSKILPKL